MHFSGESDYSKNSDDQNHDHLQVTDAANDYGPKHLVTAIPTIFPLRPPLSSTVVDASISRRFHVPSQDIAIDYGIRLSTVLTLAYALVLGAHADSPDEVMFGCIHYKNGTNASGTTGTLMTSFGQHIVFNWDETVLSSLLKLQNDNIQYNGIQLLNNGQIIHPAEATPLFRTVFSFNPASSGFYEPNFKMNHTQHDFAFNVGVIDDQKIEIEVQYASTTISEAEVEAFLDHFGVAIENITLNLIKPLSEISLISPEEQRRLTVDINPAYSPNMSSSPANNLTDLFEEQVHKTPQKIALQLGHDQFVSYKELDLLSNGLAGVLTAKGVRRGDLVGIYMDKCCEMFTAILGIHKAGGGFVPLDPEHPAERIKTVLKIGGIKIVLVQKGLHGRFESHDKDNNVTFITVDNHNLSAAANKPNVRINRDDISYALFTSGTTGVPKGVVLLHGSIIESTLALHEGLGYLDGRVLQFANYTFDTSVWDWSCTLTSGGTLCIVPKQQLMDDLGGVVRNMDITYIGLTPTVATLLSPLEVPSLQILLLGGEMVTLGLRDMWADVVTLINSYGPTETSVGVTAHNVTPSTEVSNIGRPIGKNIFYILDERLQPVPLGCVGELFISGPQVAHGYLGDPKQTAKVFVRDPFRPGLMMYASGDMVRMSPVDYTIHYLGRRDTQIKIHGLRVEIREIEAVLKTTSSMITSAVVIKADIGRDILVAFLELGFITESDDLFIVYDDEDRLSTLLASLRRAARQKLPAYMAPNVYVPLNRFPLTSSRKLDRKSLVAFFYSHQEEIRDLRLDSELSQELSCLEVPQDELQATLRSLCASILKLKEDSLSIDDNFFMVGGDSISAIRLANAARSVGIHLLTTDIIHNPTIRQLATISRTAIVDNMFDDDETPSVKLDDMGPRDLTLLDIDQSGLDILRNELHSTYDILSADVLDIYPCTALQTSFLMAGLLIDNAYIVTQIYDLPPGLISGRVEEAFDNLINHPNGAIYRTIFIFDPVTSRYLQVVMRPSCKRMEWMTVEVATETELELAIQEYRVGRGCQKFEQGELLTRVCIFELNGVPRALVWTIHHGLADHWSVNNTECDIADIYFQRPLPYRRPFKSMIKYLESLDRASSLNFWKNHLLDAKPTHFPLCLSNAPRAVVNSFISREVHIDHASFTRRFGVTAASLATGAWSAVIAAHTSSTDVVFGQVVAGRNAAIRDIDTMAGNTINTVPRRVILRPEASILETLRGIQREQIEISRHEYVGLAELKSYGVAAASLFKTLLNFTNLPGDQRSSSDVFDSMTKSLLVRRSGNYDGQDTPFTLNVTPVTTKDFYLEVNYRDGMISASEIGVILDHFEAALHFMMDHPERLICDVELINGQEMELLIPGEKPGIPAHMLNGHARPYDGVESVRNVSELIELQVKKTPEKIALQFGHNVFLTYKEMESLSNCLARKLIIRGVEKGDLVGLYMDKSVEMLLSILAVHKAGGAYVPLDPEFPTERTHTIVRLSRATMVLTSQELESKMVSILIKSTVKLVVVDFRELESAEKLDVSVHREDTCHVLFTSGSTGTPKGVVLTHGAIIESTLASRDLIGQFDGRALQFSNYTFDFSVWDWCCTLSSGGTLCIVSKQELLDDLSGVIRSLEITYLGTTPTVATLISPREVPSLQMLLLGGEMVTTELRDMWADAVSLMNIYGPTETSTCVTAHKSFTLSTEVSNIGRPIGRNNIYILDERLRPVPLGCIGQLFIGGPQVARGYLGDPEQTEKVFVKDPFRPGSTMYASGDLVRISPVDHSIHYLGRRDTQIKIHGLRVEVGEIEAVLKAASSMIINAVVIRADVERETLVAFLELGFNVESDDLSIAYQDHIGKLLTSLRRSVRQKLPAYMAPNIYVPLNKLPLSSSGKLDRNALNAFFQTHQEEINAIRLNSELLSELSFLEIPHDELQAMLRSLWATTLNLNEDLLGVDDDFFVVGGDSISAIRLAGAARTAGLSLPVTTIIRNPTIRKMARLVQSGSSHDDYEDDEIPSVTLDRMHPEDLTLLKLDQVELDALRSDLLSNHNFAPSDVIDVYPATAIQTSFLLAGLLTPDAYIMTLAWNLPPSIDLLKLQETFGHFIDHPNGAMLRTVFLFEPVSNKWLQVLIGSGRKKIEWKVVNVVDEADLELRVSEYQHNGGVEPFGFGELLTRACIFQLNGSPRVLVWTLHHALMDGWSLENMTFDIEQIYMNRHLSQRRPFRTMIKYLQHLNHEKDVEFWRRHLLDASPTPFPHRRSNVHRVADRVVFRDFRIDYNLLTRRFGIMPSTLIICAWSIVLSAHSDTTDVVFGQVLSGRNAPIKDIESMAGVMINTVPRRVILNREATILETLRQIQLDQLEISKHETTPLTELQYAGIPASGMFNTILNFKNKRFTQLRHRSEGSVADGIFSEVRKEGGARLDYPLAADVDILSTDTLSIRPYFDPESISEAEVHTFLDHLGAALHFMTDHPTSLVGDVELINDREMQLLGLLTKLDREAKGPSHYWLADGSLDSIQNVSELIELQVKKTPHKIALQFDHDAFLTYRQMESLSNCLTHILIRYGVERGNLVALYMDKSIEMFLSILAVNKAGGAYVPLDPEYPAERVNTILRLSQSATVLTTKGLQNQLALMLTDVEINLLVVDSEELDDATKPDVCVNRDDICYVLFTSGSTGTPKGVVVTHESVIESVLASRELVGCLDGRVLQFSNYTFDFSVWDWCSTLSGGGTLCVVPKQALLDNLSGVARSLDATYLASTPTVVGLISPHEVSSLQTLLVGGEMLTREVRDKWADTVKFLHMYGPTETTVCVAAHKSFTSSTKLTNIGKPFGLNAIYVLDDRLRPVPLGCVGELFISGPQVARGYLGDSEQTARAFVKDPFRPGSTMYASGDLVRMSPVDSSIHYLGRRDTQIKIHGLRVETAEIEAVLKATSSTITNAIVIKADVGNEILVAFLEIPSNAETEDLCIVHDNQDHIGTLLASLRRAARQKLPAYMCPNIYVPLNKLPLSSSGKLDRKALHAFFLTHQEEITATRLNSEPCSELSSSEVPQDELQAMLRSLWATILNLNEELLSIDDDFFVVGGDSISAIRLAGAARTAGLSLPVTAIIRNPTIRQMALFVQSAVPYDDDDRDDEPPSVTLDKMHPENLTLLKLDQDALDTLRNDLLPTNGFSASDVLDVYPATALQASLLMASMMVDHTYIVTFMWDLPPETAGPKLREALDSFLNHPNGMMLRTVFLFNAAVQRWLQVLIKPGKKHIEWTVVTVTDETELDLRVSEYEEARGTEPFSDGELLTRACVFEVNGYARVLLWTAHHALFDHWSMDNMTSDIQCIYANHPLQPRRSPKPMIKYLQRLDHGNGINFWRRHLHNASPALFPLAQRSLSSRGVVADRLIFRDINIEYSSLTRRYGIMLSTIVTCAWSLVLSAHSGTADVVFGQVLSGRNAPIREVDSMTGAFINTVPRRVILDPGVTVLQTLQRIQSEQLEITKHETVSLAELQSEGIPVSRMFNTIFNFRNKGHTASGNCGDGLFSRPRKGGGARINYPFIFNIDLVSPTTITTTVHYATAGIAEMEVHNFVDHFETALRFIIENAEKLTGDVVLINEQEMRLLVHPETLTGRAINANGQIHSPPLDNGPSSVHNMSELIQLQVERTPQKIALQFGHEVFLTYRQMDTLSNSLARKLILSGVIIGHFVALYMDKSIEMFISILAVHKAGGAYVPLDPEHPAERIKTIINLSQISFVLTTKELRTQIASMLTESEVNLTVIDFRELEPATKPDVGVNRDDICHVLFTSGSTGTPKGVVLPHGSIIDSAFASRDLVGSLDGRVLQFSNYTFDLSIWDWSCTLSGGGTLCIVPKQKLIDDPASEARSLDITYVLITPTLATLISPGEVPSLQRLLLCGEMVTPELRDTWADVVCLMNLYGPTEASTCVTAHKSFTSSTEVSNIGRPIGRNAIYILDERLRPVPLGCVGELFISGPQVARGYLGDPKQTAKVFVKDPFQPGSSMYASGDLVRMSPVDHSIYYLGRRDTQIKIHGLRVEIGEIEAVLKETSSMITNAAVIKADVGRETLVAFLALESNAELDDLSIAYDNHDHIGKLLTSLRLSVRQKLPAYMAPNIYVPLNRFPLSSAGKLDRKALGAFFRGHQEEINSSLRFDSGLCPELLSSDAPRDEFQATIRSLWASTLNLNEGLLGIDDDFFIVGGDSISAIWLAGAARAAGLSLPVTDVIHNPTIRKMAQIVQSAVPLEDYDDDETPSVAFDKMCPGDLSLLNLDNRGLDSLRNLITAHGFSTSDVLDVYPATFTQTSQLLAGQAIPGAYIPNLTWDLDPRTDVLKLRQAFDSFADHPNGMMLRTVFLFEPTSDRWLQVLIRPGARSVKWKVITVTDEKELGLRVAEYHRSYAFEPFGRGELLTRVCVFQLDGYARVIVWTLHHALMDRWFVEAMKSDIERAYHSHLLPHRRSFKSMIKYLGGLDRNIGIEFWKRHLRNAPSTFFFDRSINTRCVAANAIMFRTAHINYRSLTRRFGIMPSTLVVCAWSVVLSSRSGNTDVVFGQVLAGRNAPIKGIESMAGIMINTVPRRVCFVPQATGLEILQQIQSEQLEIGKHELTTLAELQSHGIPVYGMFDSVLNFRNRSLNEMVEHDRLFNEKDRLFAQIRHEGHGRTEYPLTLEMDILSTEALFLVLAYPSEMASEEEMQSILELLKSVMRVMVDHPEKPIGDILSSIRGR